MQTNRATRFLAGVIEGFYGPPWTQSERSELLDWMQGWGLNTYVYAPKDDLKHRAIWRELYSSIEAAGLRNLIGACARRELQFVYALSPGLDIRYSGRGDLQRLKRRFEQMLGLGCRNFSLLFDDIPDRIHKGDFRRWGSLAKAQCAVANEMFRWTRERQRRARFFFCPTAYCGRMAERGFGGEGYLAEVGRDLLPDIEVFWTGPEIVSREITVAHVRKIAQVLRRPLVIWDNLHANDYDGRRFYCGPYAGRQRKLLGEVRGLLSNPNTEFPLNYVPLRTLGEFVGGAGAWNPRAAYKRAMREWLPRFETVNGSLTLRELMLFGDCYYLPHEEGPGAEELVERASRVLEEEANGAEARAFRKQALALQQVCARMADLHDRPLFHAMHRRVWELREEMALLEGYVRARSTSKKPNRPITSDFHLPLTYRGGAVARLQRLLVQRLDGSFFPVRMRVRRSRARGNTHPAQVQGL